MTVLWNKGVRTDREVTANRPDIVIKNKKEKTYIMIDVALSADRNLTQKEAERNQNTNTANVEREMYDYTGSNLSHRNSNKRFKEQFRSHTRKALNRVTTTDSYTWNITHNTGSTAV